mgnify:CR=1 FL=1
MKSNVGGIDRILRIVLGLVLIGSGGFWLAYMNFGHVQSRLEKFFSAAPFENYQVGRV